MQWRSLSLTSISCMCALSWLGRLTSYYITGWPCLHTALFRPIKLNLVDGASIIPLIKDMSCSEWRGLTFRLWLTGERPSFKEQQPGWRHQQPELEQLWSCRWTVSVVTTSLHHHYEHDVIHFIRTHVAITLLVMGSLCSALILLIHFPDGK